MLLVRVFIKRAIPRHALSNVSAKMTTTYDVECYMCGQQLGTNAATCGMRSGSKRHRRPPCVWAASDNCIVQRCISEAKNKRQRAEEEREQLQERLRTGWVPDFSEPVEEGGAGVAAGGGGAGVTGSLTEADCKAFADQATESIEEANALLLQLQQSEHQPPAPPAPAAPPLATAPAPAAAVATSDRDRDRVGKKTNWNHTNKLMLWQAIQKYDPFSAAVKKDRWQFIADQMYDSTVINKRTPDGDFCVYTDGHGISVFFTRSVERMQRETAAEGTNSGQAGATICAETRAEFVQLQACRDLEQNAKEAQNDKRQTKNLLASLKDNEVNDALIEAAAGKEQVQLKLLKVLASRVRDAKIRASVWEQSNKGQKYTYTEADLKNVADYKTCKTRFDPNGKDATDSDTASMRGGHMAAAIEQLAAKLPTASTFNVTSASEFATQFFEAKRRHDAQRVLTLQQKLAQVDDEFTKGNINAEEVDSYKKKIKDAHFKMLATMPPPPAP